MVCDFKEEMLLVATEVSLESQSVQPVLMPRPLSFVMRSHRHSSWKGLVLMCTRCPCVHAAPRRRSTSCIHEHSRLQKGGFCTGLGRGLQSYPGHGSGHLLGHTMLVPLHLAHWGMRRTEKRY